MATSPNTVPSDQLQELLLDWQAEANLTLEADDMKSQTKNRNPPTVRYTCENVDCEVESVAIKLAAFATQSDGSLRRKPLCTCCQRPLRYEPEPRQQAL